MAFYYVKSGGSAAGDAGRATTQRTGSFTTMGVSAYYATIAAAIAATTAPAAGDFICVSSVSNNTAAASFTVPDGTIIICVSDSDADIESTGAQETKSAGSMDVTATSGGTAVHIGMVYQSEDVFSFAGHSSKHVYKNCSLGNIPGDSSTDYLRMVSDGTRVVFIDTDVDLSPSGSNAVFTGAGGGILEWYGGAVNSGTTKGNGIVQSNGTGGCSVKAVGVDFSDLASAAYIFNAVGSTTDDTTEIELDGCKLPASWTLGERPLSPAGRMILRNCDSGNTKNIYAVRDNLGWCLTETTVVRTGGASVEGTASSMVVNTESNAREGAAPFRFKLATIRDDFSSAKTLDVHIVHDSEGSGTGSHTQDDEVWVEWLIPNASDPGMTFLSSAPTDLFSPSDNATSTESWTTTGITSPVYDKLSVTTDGLGGEGWAECYLCVGKPSAEIFACPAVEVS